MSANSLTYESSAEAPAPKWCLTLDHLASYPTIAALAAYLLGAPGVKFVTAKTGHVLGSLNDRTKFLTAPLYERAAPLVKKVDALGDSTLTKLDSRFPQVKTTQPCDIYEGAQARVNSVRDTAQHSFEDRVVKPISGVAQNAAESAKTQYQKVYDSQFNDRIAPINDRLETVIDAYLPQTPEAGSVKKDGSQLERTFSLARNAASRAAPQIEAARDSTRKHIISIYSDKLTGTEKPSLLERAWAVASTSKTVGHEASEKLLSAVRPKEKIDAAVEQVKTTANTYVSDVQKAVGDAVAKAQERVGVTSAAPAAPATPAAPAATVSADTSAVIASPTIVDPIKEQILPVSPVY